MNIEIFYYEKTGKIHSIVKRPRGKSRLSSDLCAQGLRILSGVAEEMVNYRAKQVNFDDAGNFIGFDGKIPKKIDFPMTIISPHERRVIFRRRGPGLGDVVMTLSAVQQMRRLYPQMEIIYLSTPPFKDILEQHPAIDLILEDGESIPTGTLINLDDPCPASRYESAQSPNIHKSRHEIFVLSSGLPWEGDMPQLYLSPEERQWAAEQVPSGINIGIELACAEKWRDYPDNAKLARALLKRGYNVFVFDKNTALKVKGVENIIGYPLRQVMALIGEMMLMICPDSGLGHIAGALGVPLLGLFGPTCPSKRIEIYGGQTLTGQCDKMPCWYNYCKERHNYSPCMKQIKVTDIMRKVSPSAQRMALTPLWGR